MSNGDKAGALPLKKFLVELKRECSISRVVEAESEAGAREFAMTTIGIVDFALSYGAKVSKDNITLEKISEFVPG